MLDERNAGGLRLPELSGEQHEEQKGKELEHSNMKRRGIRAAQAIQHRLSSGGHKKNLCCRKARKIAHRAQDGLHPNQRAGFSFAKIELGQECLNPHLSDKQGVEQSKSCRLTGAADFNCPEAPLAHRGTVPAASREAIFLPKEHSVKRLILWGLEHGHACTEKAYENWRGDSEHLASVENRVVSQHCRRSRTSRTSE